MRLPTIGTLIQDADAKDSVKSNLAAAYGQLTADSFKKMDNELKIIIGYTVSKIAALGGELTWDKIVACMNENKLLQLMKHSAIENTDSHTETGSGFFKTDGSANNAVVRKVNQWFIRLVADADVLKDTGIDINFLARMVAESGATVDSIGAVFYKWETYSRDVMDVNVLRYPDLDAPFFKVYHIVLGVWRTCERIAMVQRDWSGIKGTYSSRCYEARSSAIKGLKKEVIDTAVSEAESLFA